VDLLAMTASSAKKCAQRCGKTRENIDHLPAAPRRMMTMFDDLRAQANQTSFEDEPEPEDVYAFQEEPVARKPFLGMTAPQRFLITLLLLMMTCILSTFCLMVTEKIWLPF
jgi:hypothetical protein